MPGILERARRFIDNLNAQKNRLPSGGRRIKTRPVRSDNRWLIAGALSLHRDSTLALAWDISTD
ncbi:MAG: hypothetical protein ONB14_05760, partial [candidate division KSB1 bacterium]|nr:hypothetical protein [candidate division KSB1 bacterium]